MPSLSPFLVVLALLVGGVPISTAASARTTSGWVRPVSGRVERPFLAPKTRFGRGHLGVDFAVAPGTPVHAVGAGTVDFAGKVGRARFVVVRHAGGLRTSYAYLATITVRRGEVVRAGAIVGTSGGRGENHEPGVFHLGLRRGDTFVDPMQLFASSSLAPRVHLAPDSGGDPGPDGSRRRPLEWGRFRTDSGGRYLLFARP